MPSLMTFKIRMNFWNVINRNHANWPSWIRRCQHKHNVWEKHIWLHELDLSEANVLFSDLLAVQCPFDEVWFNIPPDEVWWAIRILINVGDVFPETTQNRRHGSAGVRIGMMFGGIIFVLCKLDRSLLSRECSAAFSLFSTHLTNQKAASSWWSSALFTILRTSNYT